MDKSTNGLTALLDALGAEAARQQLTDTEWAALARLRKETLSRLRHRQDCDLSTLQALAQAVGAQLTVSFRGPHSKSDEHFPAEVDRDYEERLVDLASSGILEPGAWRALGPPFFMAGLAVMLASRRGADRRGLLDMAEQLHPGISEPAVFSLWLERSPVRPSRFHPLVTARGRHAA
jgi:hypothetical protein